MNEVYEDVVTIGRKEYNALVTAENELGRLRGGVSIIPPRLRIERRPLLVSGMLADSLDGPLILIDSEQPADEQRRAKWHEVVHMVWQAEGGVAPHDEKDVDDLARACAIAESLILTK